MDAIKRAVRPFFGASKKDGCAFFEESIEFDWHSGLGWQVRQRSSKAMADAIVQRYGTAGLCLEDILEVSTASDDYETGKALSAINLTYQDPESGRFFSVENLFQAALNLYFTDRKYKSSILGKECDFVRGPFGGSLKKNCFVDAGYPVYEQQHAIYNRFVFRYYVNEKKYLEMKRFTVNGGDLIMSCSGTIGKVAIVPMDAPKGIINQALLKLTPKTNLIPEYLLWYMNSISFTKQIQEHSQGAAIKNVASVAILKQISLPLPSVNEQREIIQHLNELSNKCEVLQNNYTQTIALCDDLKQALLRKAFSGEL